MFAIFFLVLTVCSRNVARLVLDTGVSAKHNPIDMYRWTGTGGVVCVKHGRARTICRKNVGRDFTRVDEFFFMHPSSISINARTIVWTNSDDAMLIDYAKLYSMHNSKIWGGNGSQAWCLSKDPNDEKFFNDQGDVIPANTCFTSIDFNPNGHVYGYHYNAAGRRALDEADPNGPTGADFDRCMEDPTREDEECEDIADRIIAEEFKHPENWVDVSLTQNSDEDVSVEAVAIHGVQEFPLLVNALAALGLVVVLYGSFRHYTSAK